MDSRWSASPLDTKGNTQVWYHPTASIEDVQNGIPKDSIDISPWVSGGKQTSATLTITLDYNNEFDGAAMPSSQQIVSTMEDGKNLSIMVIETITSITKSFGKNSLTITARSRETQDIWKLTKYVTNQYPQSTNISTIITDVANQVGLVAQDLLIPVSAITTSHTNTQLANLSAWEMMGTLFLPLGQTPVIDAIGRLKGVSKDLSNRLPDHVLDNTRLVKFGATRSRPPTTRYILQWLDPNLTIAEQQARKLAETTLTAGFFTPVFWKHLAFSADGSQCATQTYLRPKTSVNQFRIGGTVFLPCFLELWDQQTPAIGRLTIITLGWTYVVLAAAFLTKLIAASYPDGVTTAPGTTIPLGKRIEAACDIAIFTIMAAMGTGDYEIWGVPYSYVHARNTSEAYSSTALAWADNPVTEECDFIMNEAHAQAVCTRELIYQAAAANTQNLTIVEDRSVEKGDIIQLPDGSQMYVLDFTRGIMSQRDNTLDVSGFTI
jgi:hypothetical protein